MVKHHLSASGAEHTPADDTDTAPWRVKFDKNGYQQPKWAQSNQYVNPYKKVEKPKIRQRDKIKVRKQSKSVKKETKGVKTAPINPLQAALAKMQKAVFKPKKKKEPTEEEIRLEEERKQKEIKKQEREKKMLEIQQKIAHEAIAEAWKDDK